MSCGPKAAAVVLTEEERETLQRLVRRRGAGQAAVMRARIVLAADAEPGLPNGAIAVRLGVSRQSVITWRGRFLAHRLEGLVDAPRSGAPRRVGDEAVEAMITRTLESQPEGATHWSTRAMARQVGMSQTMVSRIWRAFGLQPHRSETFKLSRDPAFVDKVRDVVGLYLNPPDRALVLCVDEKPQIQANEGTAPVLPMRPGQVERHSHDYVRHGTTDLFAALDVKAGTVIGTCKGRHRATEFRAFLDQVEAAVPADLDVHLVLDNAATHKTKLIHDWLLKRPRWHLHFTPTSASWLNLVEGWFSLLTRRCLQRGAFASTDALKTAIQGYIDQTNAEPKPFVWTKSADDILASVGRFCQRISNSNH
ncbi:IS630 family transposase [Roseomonas harenae]|uniref:IS630 family transposase n=1 Tax=Muricoccus harenae TaxID=2692566 RepID=UPI001331BE60|nr:IS630 family transposase [Roseomonas harenae]